ncbi:hypothetical protein [Amycolatopsis thermophila]|uniref:Uncharacterized protein n=1 Tax=Amycolatopsis thermophila TaxID=206084 RepID=A0ABU0ETG3_9PSEU|nr:hypothetical protein [Amycolatopsis thermophila]MDQ0378600.1 hypothetical protein [Amycolatopsis thermophila]
MFGKKNRKRNDVAQVQVLHRSGLCAGCGKRVSKHANCCGKPACSRRIASQL